MWQRFIGLAFCLGSSNVRAFAPPATRQSLPTARSQTPDLFSIFQQDDNEWQPSSSTTAVMALVAASTLLIPEAALAVNSDPIPNALVAYGHYASLFVCTALLTYERTAVAAGMDEETEKNLVKADSAYGLTALVVGVTGIYRAIDYGKGWDFYSHEPFFWVKLAFVGLWASLSLFPTITLVKRGIPLFQGETVEPMSEKLEKRMKQVITAELSAIFTIPVTATLMARGVGYNESLPWQVGAAFVVLVTGGSAFLYGKQALTWTEDEVVVEE